MDCVFISICIENAESTDCWRKIKVQFSDVEKFISLNLTLRLSFSFWFFIKSCYLWHHQIFVIFVYFGYVYTFIVLVSVFALKMLKVLRRLWEQVRSSIFLYTEIHICKLRLRVLFSFLFFLSKGAVYDVIKFLWFLLISDMFTHGLCWYQYLHSKCSKFWLLEQDKSSIFICTEIHFLN